MVWFCLKEIPGAISTTTSYRKLFVCYYLSRTLNFGHCTCIAVQLLYNEILFLVSFFNNIVTICTLVYPINYWWEIQSPLCSGMEFFFSPWNKLICDPSLHKTIWWIFSVVISRQHFGNYNKSEFIEFLGILHIHHKVHNANLLTNLKIDKILKELETLTHTCVHTNNT